MSFIKSNTYGAFPKLKGSMSSIWKGDNVSYRQKHIHLNRTYGKPDTCDNKICLGKSKNYEWANISGEYKREREDYLKLCRSCHKRFDMGLIKILGYNKPLKYKFNKTDIDNIRRQYKTKKKTQVQLAKEYNVDPSSVSYICNNKHYKI